MPERLKPHGVTPPRPRQKNRTSLLGRRTGHFYFALTEPNIALIYKFCEVLHVQPNELFGFGPSTGGHTAGFAEQKVADFEVAPMGEVAAQVLGWKLARSMVRLHAVEAGSAVPTGMAEHRAAATAFMELERAPVHTVSTFLARHSFARVAKSELDELTALVEQYLALLSTRAGNDRPAK